MVKGDKLNCYNHKVKSAICFGLGLLTASVLPSDWVLIIAAATLVAVSFTCSRR
ncbi:MAG: hypothetical protein MJ089_07855 [Ruminococcus sp.]|nr:hypothetical protein [Ruminococcus sp.]